MTINIDQQAQQIIIDNDRGGYTVPTAGLYPYQWNWDSAFVALGFMQFDQVRAWQELETLVSAQWDNGMIPHIIFRQEKEGYFPGPKVWQADKGPISSTGISQPPVLASVVWRLVDQIDSSQSIEKAQQIFTQLNAFHQWWHNARDIEGSGLVKITHPWESGRDNLPDWDEAYADIDVGNVGEYQRNDTQHVDSEMRPTKAHYDCYLALVQHGVSCDWDDIKIAQTNPFWVADVGVNAIFIRAEKDLLKLALKLNLQPQASAIKARIERLEKGFEQLWNPEKEAYCTLNLRTNHHSEHVNSATFMCFYADVGSKEQRKLQLKRLNSWQQKVNFMVPSFNPYDELYDELRYWRGPVWGMINYLIATGLSDAGESKWAEAIRKDTYTLIKDHGFAEYFSPATGQGCGGDTFSWTAAMWLCWAKDAI